MPSDDVEKGIGTIVAIGLVTAAICCMTGLDWKPSLAFAIVLVGAGCVGY